MRYFQRATSLRVLASAIFAGIILGWLASLISEDFGFPIFAATAVGVLLIQVLNEDNVIVCPECRGRVKLGASRCRHCGQPVR